MNAPDKIYIEQFPEGHFSETWHQYDQSTRTIKVHEYIRKDALLEWVKEKNLKFTHNGNEQNDIFVRGIAAGLGYLISKLSSL